MRQDLSQCKIFYEVARADNVSKAVKELYINQPTISKTVSKLEDSPGLPLFTRGSRGVQLTVGGEVPFRHIREAFDALERGRSESKRIQESDIGHLRIGVSNTLRKCIPPPYLKTFTDQYPHMKVTIESQSTTQTLIRLEQQEVGLGLVAEPSVRKDLVFISVMDMQDIFVTALSHPENLYLGKGRDTNIFKTGNIMPLDTSSMARHHVDEYMPDNNITPRQVLEMTTMGLPIEFAKVGPGIGYVTKELIQGELGSGILVEIPLEIPIYKRTIGLFCHPANQALALRTFLEFLY